jgi:DNA-binding transcriptional LysR family regulator
MRSLNLDQLRALETVIELASFTAAAKRLNLSQSTISVQIRELEKRFGVRLVERLGKRAAATSAGHELIDHTRRISADVELAALAMQRRREGSLGQVKVGATTTALNYFLSPILESLRRRHPRIELSIVVDTTTGQVERLLNDEIDFGLVNLPVKERSVQVIPLRIEQLVAIFPADAPDVPRQVTPEYMARHRLLLEAAKAHIKALVLDWLSPATRQLRPAMLLDNFDTITRMVAVGLGASIVPASIVGDALRRKDLIVRPLQPRLQRTLGLILHKNKVLDRAMRIFHDAVLHAKDRARKPGPKAS